MRQQQRAKREEFHQVKTRLQDWRRPLGLSLRLRALSMAAIFMISGCALTHKRLPYQDPDRLVSVIKVTPAGEEPVLVTDFIELQKQSRTLGKIAAYVSSHVNLTVGSQPERISSTLVSADLFSSLGVTPMLGRAILPQERHPGANRVAVISHNLWQRNFRSDPNVIGRTVTLDHENYTIVGVMPGGFQFPEDCEMWLPLAPEDQSLRLNDKSFRFEVIARLSPSFTLEQAQAEMGVIASKLERDHPESNSGRGIKLTLLSESRSQK